MTFSEFIIKERGENFYYISLGDIIKAKSTLEVWFSHLYTDYKIFMAGGIITVGDTNKDKFGEISDTGDSVVTNDLTHDLKIKTSMTRFMGMMPSSEVKIEKRFKDSLSLVITIQAGDNGWTIIYADGSTEYKDVKSTTDANFNEAFDTLKSHFSEIEEIIDTKNCVVESDGDESIKQPMGRGQIRIESFKYIDRNKDNSVMISSFEKIISKENLAEGDKFICPTHENGGFGVADPNRKQFPLLLTCKSINDTHVAYTELTEEDGGVIPWDMCYKLRGKL